MKSAGKIQRVLAVASSGGHWVELLRLIPAFVNHEIVFVTVMHSYRSQVPGKRFYIVNDANRRNRFGLIQLALQAIRLAWIVAKERPDVVISTGAAPGYFAVVCGHLLGARTVWVDSMSNIERLSGTGSRIGWCTDLWLTQWPHLARSEGPRYGGSVL